MFIDSWGKQINFSENHNNLVVFLPKDNALLPTLEFYKRECKRIGASPKHIDKINQLIVSVTNWRVKNKEKCKIPD